MPDIAKQRIALAAVALALAGGTSFAQDSEGPGDAPSEPQQQPVVAADPDQAASFGVLRREAASPDTLPNRAAEFVRHTVTGGNGAAPGLARRAVVTPSGSPVYVIPARGHLCTYVVTAPDQGYGSCARTGVATQGESIATDTPSPGITRIVGLVPDGIRDVTLRAKDGTTERTAVSGNAYVFETAKTPKQVEFGGKVVPAEHPVLLP